MDPEYAAILLDWVYKLFEEKEKKKRRCVSLKHFRVCVQLSGCIVLTELLPQSRSAEICRRPSYQSHLIRLYCTVLCKSNESKLREFCSLSLRLFKENLPENSSVFSQCLECYFFKSKEENSPHFRDQN